jgi:hypothetical protein
MGAMENGNVGVGGKCDEDEVSLGPLFDDVHNDE